MKKLILALCAFAIAHTATAQPARVVRAAEEDGSPAVTVGTIKFPNGSVTDNANGTVSISFGSVTATNAVANTSGAATNMTLFSTYGIVAGAVIERYVTANSAVTNILYSHITNALPNVQSGDHVRIWGNQLVYANTYTDDSTAFTAKHGWLEGVTNVVFEGLGGARLYATNYGHLFTAQNVTNVTFRNIVFDGQRATSAISTNIVALFNRRKTNYGMTFDGCKFINAPDQALSQCFTDLNRNTQGDRIINNTFRDIGTTNFIAFSQPDGAAISGLFRDSFVSGNYISNSMYGIEFDGGGVTDTKQLTGQVIGNKINTYQWGLTVRANGNTTTTNVNLMVVGNEFGSPIANIYGDHAQVLLIDANNVLIADNLFNGDTDTTTYSFHIMLSATAGNGNRNISIHDNRFMDADIGIYQPSGSGPAYNLSVRGNSFVRNRLDSMRIYSVQGGQIDDNEWIEGSNGALGTSYIWALYMLQSGSTVIDNLSIRGNRTLVTESTNRSTFLNFGALGSYTPTNIVISHNIGSFKYPSGSTYLQVAAGNIAAYVNETGSGNYVRATSPTLVTPALGTIASGVGTALTALNGSNISSGTVPTARLGSGTADASTYLRGDQTWATVSGAGDVTAAATFGTDNRLIRSDGTSKGVQASVLTLSDVGALTGVESVAVTNGITAASASVNKLVLNQWNAGTIANGGTLTLVDTTNFVGVNFSGATANITLPASPTHDIFIYGTNSYNSGSQIITVSSSLLWTGRGYTSATLTNSSAADGRFILVCRYSGGAFVGLEAVGDAWSSGGSGTVTSVAQSFTGGLISVAGSPVTSSGTLALTVAGTSGGVPYFSSGSTWASSGALTANSLVLGGGAGAAPATVAGITSDGVSVLNLGVNATTLGKVKMFGSTSGDATVQPAAVAGTATIQTLPATTGTLVNRVTTANGVSASNSDGALTVTLGAITPTTVNGNTITTGTGTLTLGTGKTLTANNTITLAGTDSTTMTFPTTSATIARTDAANTFSGIQSMTSPDFTTSVTTPSASFTAFAGATTLLTIGGTGASASMFAPSTLDATSSTTGAIRTSGGISAAKALNVGTTITGGGALSIGTANAATVGTIELGHATDTTIGRSAAGVLAIEGVAVLGGGEAIVASATTTDIGAATSALVSITGTTTITGFGTVASGTVRHGRFTGALTLTHNATSLILPGAANITTAAGDRFGAHSLGAGNWVVDFYTKADGTAVVGGGGGAVPIQFHVHGSLSLGDSTSYYFGSADTWVAATPNQVSIKFPRAGTISRVEYQGTYSVAGSNEAVNFYVRFNDTTDNCNATVDMSAAALVATGVWTGTQSVSANDVLVIKVATPAWATNPTNIRAMATVWFTP